MVRKKRKKRPEPKLRNRAAEVALSRNSAGPMRDRRKRRPKDHKRKTWLHEE